MSLAESMNYTSTRRRLVLLRWLLLAGLALAVLAAPTFLEIALPLPPLLAVLLLLGGFNAVAQWRAAGETFGAPELAGQLAVDLAGMGVLLYLAGGAANPLVSLMLLPVAVAALSLPGRWVAGIATLAVGLYSFLMLHSLPLPIADAARATRLHLGGMWLTFVVSAVLMAWFFTRMMASIRERDAQLAKAREEALRAAQVVALGQLAAGAAHELGTPLATINILAGDLLQDTRLPGDAREDMSLLCQQIAICKEIVGTLMHRAGVERAGDAQCMPADAWLNGLLARWRTLWPQASCILDTQSGVAAPRIVIEVTLEQAITNLLNNAAKVAPNGMRVLLAWNEKWLRIAVQDQGPGFPAGILQRCGAEPIAAHAQGAGIGLWLTRAAVERMGGHMHLENRPTGGVATLELPLSLSATGNTEEGRAQ
jgi:two-component system sensor histidine kinase RegB